MRNRSATSRIIDGPLAPRLTGVPHVWHIPGEIGARGMSGLWLSDLLLARVLGRVSDVLVANSESEVEFCRRQGLGGQGRAEGSDSARDGRDADGPENG